ncbi:MAG TPA: DUF3108 domain-containing protein [Patescibacteria group bacterium]|nr:DUF3108 domain-containing protein [Patescibacteria group bacterium]
MSPFLTRVRSFKNVCFRILTLFFALYSSSQAQVFSAGEEIIYSVSYLGIRLGTVKIITEGKEIINGKQVFKTKSFMTSSPGIPFVDLNATYESWIDKSGAFSQQFVGTMKQGDEESKYTKYVFDYDNKITYMQEWKNKKQTLNGTMDASKKWNDGLSLLFLARHYVDSKKHYKVPTIIEGDTVKTTINFQGKVENVEIDAVQYPVRTKYLSGIADWTGVYGLSGKFEGWFSDDEAKIPVRAKMKVYLGSVNIELISWKRGSWMPPKAGDTL